MPNRNLQKTSHSRIFTTEDRAGPSHAPIYQTLGRAMGLDWSLGDVTAVRVPDDKQYGSFVTVDTIRGQRGLPTTSVEFRKTRNASALLTLARKGCPLDLQIHIGLCKDPSDFDRGWEKIEVYEDAALTNLSGGEAGAFDQDQDAPVMETGALTAQDYYEILPLGFAQKAESEIVQQVVAIAICDARTCGVCGIPSDGCQRVFVLQTPVGASPGLTPELVYTQNGGGTFSQGNITSLPANGVPTGMACVGPYLVVISNSDCSIHYALITDILAGTPGWTEVLTGLVCVAGAPNDIFSTGRTKTWIVGAGGYIYFSEDITGGVTPQASGDVTVQNLFAIDGIDDNQLIVGGASNALLLTRNGGQTWVAITGPSAQAAVTINTLQMLSENEWVLGYADGEMWYTIDGGVNWTQKGLPSQATLTAVDKIVFATRVVGYAAVRTATAGRLLRTINGGYSWYQLPEATGLNLPTNANLQALAACGENPNVVWAGGLEVSAGDGILLKGA